MSVEIVCPHCDRKLRIEESHVGGRVRCPVCDHVLDVPETAEPPPPEKSATDDQEARADDSAVTSDQPSDSVDVVDVFEGLTTEIQPVEPTPPRPEDLEAEWYLRIPEGLQYGPITRIQLNQWVQDGRVANDCEVRRGDEGAWSRADAEYPILLVPASHLEAPQRRIAEKKRIAKMPHRGAMILVLGILGWLATCPAFAVLAWIFGTMDLQQMRDGTMDEQGQTLTQAGQILGMTYCLVCIVAVIVGVLAFMIV